MKKVFLRDRNDDFSADQPFDKVIFETKW